MQQVLEKLDMIRYLILDVDGTMTDGGIYLDSRGRGRDPPCKTGGN